MEPRQFGDLGSKRSPGVKLSRTLHGIWLFRKLFVPADAEPESAVRPLCGRRQLHDPKPPLGQRQHCPTQDSIFHSAYELNLSPHMICVENG